MSLFIGMGWEIEQRNFSKILYTWEAIFLLDLCVNLQPFNLRLLAWFWFCALWALQDDYTPCSKKVPLLVLLVFFCHSIFFAFKEVVSWKHTIYTVNSPSFPLSFVKISFVKIWWVDKMFHNVLIDGRKKHITLLSMDENP
jgi:hypothetical protein